MKTIKRAFWSLIFTGALLAVGVVYARPDWVVVPPSFLAKASAQEPNNKYDGDCTGHETVGRCADKCPQATDQGTYYLQGFDKETGAAICRLEYYHACPYADAQPADSDICRKLEAENQTNNQGVTEDVSTSSVDSGFGK